MILCPSCGSNVQGDLCLGCPSCGARAIGPPLARPQHELASYGRATIAFVGGALMAVGFLGSTITALIQNKSLTFRFWRISFWTLVAGGETAAWRMKWLAIPVAVAVLWSSSKIARSIQREPKKFVGLLPARIGFACALTVTVMIAALIAITIPVRLERRDWAIEAENNARGHAVDRALTSYRDLNGTYPAQENWIGALRTVPDPDGTIAEALRFVDAKSYQAGTTLASAPSAKARPMLARGSALRNVQITTSPDPTGVPFTSYEFRLLNERRFLSNEDDLIIRDGAVTKAAEASRPSLTNSSRPNPR